MDRKVIQKERANERHVVERYRAQATDQSRKIEDFGEAIATVTSHPYDLSGIMGHNNSSRVERVNSRGFVTRATPSPGWFQCLKRKRRVPFYPVLLLIYICT